MAQSTTPQQASRRVSTQRSGQRRRNNAGRLEQRRRSGGEERRTGEQRRGAGEGRGADEAVRRGERQECRSTPGAHRGFSSCGVPREERRGRWQRGGPVCDAEHRSPLPFVTRRWGAEHSGAAGARLDESRQRTSHSRAELTVSRRWPIDARHATAGHRAACRSAQRITAASSINAQPSGGRQSATHRANATIRLIGERTSTGGLQSRRSEAAEVSTNGDEESARRCRPALNQRRRMLILHAQGNLRQPCPPVHTTLASVRAQCSLHSLGQFALIFQLDQTQRLGGSQQRCGGIGWVRKRILLALSIVFLLVAAGSFAIVFAV